MGRLARHLRPAHVQVTETLDDLCDRLITTLLPDQRSRDDSALLVARTQALAPENVSCLQLQDDPTAAGQARAHVRAQLAAWNLDELIMTTELVASELVGNVVRHARGADHPAAAARPNPHLRSRRRQPRDAQNPSSG
ncbi:ATP-binding protein [Streptomyces sp. NBC_01728]|uniref:ATP-binding protein n=1 Tax=unclassified Streptomyces TaxID=2593676 RepID=UPI002257DF22|nr:MULTISPECIES: hypothetical protein [unclassified Streptomyces]MCX4462182.1 ATP-binding protein [Streptomyces sp. NBC_01719]MCX4491090.1 ATP-binding protein [Streptomyces sp. NBC_01728]